VSLEVRHLRAICAIARAGSVSRAAIELGMSQPSLTALLQRLEKQLGAALFVRGHAGVVPTPLGDQLVRRAQVALAEFDHLVADLTGDRLRRRLRVGISQMECATALIQEVDRLFPDDDPTFVVESSATALAQALAHGHHDISVLLIADNAAYQLAPRLSNRVVLPTVPIFVALSAEHRFATQLEVDLMSLADAAWISPPGLEDGSLAELRAAAWQAGFEPRLRFTFPYGGGGALIVAGSAVRLVEPSASPLPGISIKPLADDPIRMRMVLAWRRERVSASQADQVYRALRSTYSQLARRSATYVDWWERRRNDELWARQLDAIFE
jgi:DNA-binding transcriptional LysR family regulator